VPNFHKDVKYVIPRSRVRLHTTPCISSVLVKKLVLCTWLSSGALEVWSLQLWWRKILC